MGWMQEEGTGDERRSRAYLTGRRLPLLSTVMGPLDSDLIDCAHVLSQIHRCDELSAVLGEWAHYFYLLQFAFSSGRPLNCSSSCSLLTHIASPILILLSSPHHPGDFQLFLLVLMPTSEKTKLSNCDPLYPTIWQGDNMLSGGQLEWAAEDAAQHALNLNNWRIKILKVNG
eukprot:760984-Hanusia_phi.AAC.1